MHEHNFGKWGGGEAMQLSEGYVNTDNMLMLYLLTTAISQHTQELEVLLDHNNQHPITYCSTFKFLYEPSNQQGSRRANLFLSSRNSQIFCQFGNAPEDVLRDLLIIGVTDNR